MTDEELDAMEHRANEATRGPWTFADEDESSWFIEAPSVGPFMWFDPDKHIGDAEFIAHARDDVPVLVAEVRRLRAAVPSPEPSARANHKMSDEERSTLQEAVAHAVMEHRGRSTNSVLIDAVVDEVRERMGWLTDAEVVVDIRADPSETSEMRDLRDAAKAYAADPELIERARTQREIASTSRVGVVSADELKAALEEDLAAVPSPETSGDI